MLIRSLLVSAALLFAGAASAATCSAPTFSLGALPGGMPSAGLSSSCTGGSGPNGDPSRSFADYYSFTLTDPASSMVGQFDLHLQRDFTPGSPTFGQFLSGISVQAISLIFDGVETFVGTGFGIGGAERASFFATDLLAGDYTLAIYGATFGASGNGYYDGNVGVEYVSHAPEPGTYAMMVLGLLGVGYAVRRRSRR
jgi:hypothetical protein